jgi:lipopolysaccharide/colanic/teichoic acid biosynthesis glycosyltransferase
VKRLFDVMLAALGLAIASPLLLVVALAIWLQDFRSPFYVGVRAGRGGRPFRMVKFRCRTSAPRSMWACGPAVEDGLSAW